MSIDLLNRTDAPFKNEFWEMIDLSVKSIAQMQLSGRKLLYTEGPAGLGLQFVPGYSRNESDNDLLISVPQGVPLIQLSSSFSISGRDIEAFNREGLKINLQNLVYSLQKITSAEDKLIFYGLQSSGIYGLLTEPNVQRIKLSSWDQAGDAVQSITGAIEALDKENFHGPYSLALSTSLYNKLFRKYPDSDIVEIDHLKMLVADGIIKSSSIRSGGVILSSSLEFSSLVLGQDLSAGFEGPSGTDYVFTLSETIALRISVPKSVCVLDVS